MKTVRMMDREIYRQMRERYNKFKVIRVQIPAIDTTAGMAQVHPGASQPGSLQNSAGTTVQEHTNKHYRRPLCWRFSNTEA